MMQPPPPPPPPPQVEVMALNAASAAAQQQHQHMLLDVEAKRLASSMDVPTLPDQVRTALRDLTCPVRLFGENLANVRDRLRLELAKRKVYGEHYGSAAIPEVPGSALSAQQQPKRQETEYTRASQALVKAREKITAFSLQRAKERLIQERGLRATYKALQLHKKRKPDDTTTEEIPSESFAQAEKMDRSCFNLYKSLQQTSLAGSQYGDSRALSAITTLGDRVLTASWSSTLQWWDGSTPALDLLGRKRQAHEDRIMGVAVQQQQQQKILAGTASIDLTAKLWTLKEADAEMKDVKPKGEQEQDDTPLPYELEEVAHLTGHAARLCKIAFHPQGDLVATTSHDHTWRLWDIETAGGENGELLLQDGHADKVYGIDFHPDGSLCAVTDYSGMIHVWDLRTGKSALHYYGHAGRVLCAKFAPTNGFQMATAGDDGSIKVWDLRHRRKAKGNVPEARRTIPAHSKLIQQLEYSTDDEVLVSCSFDGTAKLWSTRGDWKSLQTLAGHEGKVMGVGIVTSYEDKKAEAAAKKSRDWGIVTCGYDKTLKLWK